MRLRFCNLATNKLQGYFCSWTENIEVFVEFVYHFAYLAFRGNSLAQLTLLFLVSFRIEFHHRVPSELWSWIQATRYLIACLLISSFFLLGLLYRHSIHTIFNSRIPTRFLPSLKVHLEMLKPLEIIWRYLTRHFRVLPDLIILGEVRCGTTSLCQHLASIDGCYRPFCLWRHPELDGKETFYFVGHYLGKVDPLTYRMCFPMVITRFLEKYLFRRMFFTFDGCAQYLSSPTAPYLISKAYSLAGLPPPVLVACVRNPIDQAISWWNYENNAVLWGKSMGLNEWNSVIRTSNYPPSSLESAIEFSLSDEVENMYLNAESLFQKIDSDKMYTLPDWALTWPGGQLSGIGRNGHFAANIQRYENVFTKTFGNPKHSNRVPKSSSLRFVNVISIDCLSDSAKLFETIESLRDQIRNRQGNDPKTMSANKAWHQNAVHRNAGVQMQDSKFIVTPKERETLVKLFSKDSQNLQALCGTEFGWQLLNNSRLNGK
jgi:hypothetical protein